MKQPTYKEVRNSIENQVARYRANAELKALEEYSNVPFEVLFAEALKDVERINDYDLQEELDAWNQ